MKPWMTALICAIGLSACTKDESDTDDTDMVDTDDTDVEATLYDTLGGETAVHAVVGEFLTVVSADTRINWFFATTDIADLQGKLEDQICVATGGPCTYTGGTMVAVHADMAITDEQFDALAEDMLAALDNLGIPYALDGSQPIDGLLVSLVGMKSDIVTDPSGDDVYFNQLGGHAAVVAVIQDFLGHVVADSRINGFFADVDAANLGRLLVEQVCNATGGYCEYTGRSMADAHEGLCIGDDDFNALVEDMILAFDDNSVPHSETLDGSALGDGLLNALASMKPEIVENCAQ